MHKGDDETSQREKSPIAEAGLYSEAEGPAVVRWIDQYMQTVINLKAIDTADCWLKYIFWHHNDHGLFLFAMSLAAMGGCSRDAVADRHASLLALDRLAGLAVTYVQKYG